MAVAVAVIAVAVAAASAYESSQQSKAAAKKQKEASRVSQAEQAAQQTQSRRQQLREERVRRSQIAQASQNTGVSESSGELGAQSALGTLIQGNLANSNRQQASSEAIGGLQQGAANNQLAAAQWQAVGSFASSVFGVAAGAIGTGNKPATGVKPTNASQGSIFNTTA